MNKEMIISSTTTKRGWPFSRTTRSSRSSSSARSARRGRQHLQGAGLEGAARHAVVVRRHRARARRVPLRHGRRQHRRGVRPPGTGEDDDDGRRRARRRPVAGARGRRRRRGRRARRRPGCRGSPRRAVPNGGVRAERRGRDRRATSATATAQREDRRPAEGRAGDPRPGRQGAARHQGRAHHLARHHARPVPGLHADGRSHRRLAQDRVARGARRLRGIVSSSASSTASPAA